MSILDILEAHTLAYDWSPCSCGVKWVWDGRGSGPEQHRAHVAQVLERHEREAKAEVLEEASTGLTDWTESPLMCLDKCGDPKCPDDIRIGAIEDAQRWLRNRATQLRKETETR